MVLALIAFSSSPALAEEPAAPPTCAEEPDAAKRADCERAAALAVAEGELAALGDCAAVKKDKKRAECEQTRNDLQLRIASLQPKPDEPTKSRALPKKDATSPGTTNLELDYEDD